jgi:hypothetical protein
MWHSSELVILGASDSRYFAATRDSEFSRVDPLLLVVVFCAHAAMYLDAALNNSRPTIMEAGMFLAATPTTAPKG